MGGRVGLVAQKGGAFKLRANSHFLVFIAVERLPPGRPTCRPGLVGPRPLDGVMRSPQLLSPPATRTSPPFFDY